MSNGRVGRDVYWRRRLLLVAVVIALVWGVLQVVGMFGADGDDRAEPSTSTPTTEVTSAPTTAPPADQVSVALDTSTVPCEPENVRIVPSVPRDQFAGGPVAIDLMLTTLDGAACTFQPDANELLVVVDTQRAPIYDSSVCRAAFFAQSVAIPAQWGTVAGVEWSGRGSGTACGTSEGFAPAGTYTLKIGTYGGEPGEATFRLQRRAPETPATTAPTEGPSRTPASQPTPAEPKASSTAR